MSLSGKLTYAFMNTRQVHVIQNVP